MDHREDAERSKKRSKSLAAQEKREYGPLTKLYILVTYSDRIRKVAWRTLLRKYMSKTSKYSL
jgi:hypothetical protein